MKILKTREDIEAASLPSQLNEYVTRLFDECVEEYTKGGYEFRPEDDGFIVLIEEQDTDDSVSSLCGYNLRNALYEGGSMEGGCFVVCTLHNNQFGITFIIPDEPWLDAELRKHLVEVCAAQETAR